MKIQDFTDMKRFEELMSIWAKATGLATVAVGADGEYISECYNFTEFCIDLTRGSEEGCRRCVKCDQEGQGVYHCHAGLVDFGIPLQLADGTVLGSVIGGQVLPKAPDEEQFRKVAREIGVDEDKYIEALRKVTIKPEEMIQASAQMLGETINNFINAEYNSKYSGRLIENLKEGVEECQSLVKSIQKDSKMLDTIQRKQNMLALNASIEAARAGDAGRGFTVVASEVSKLAKDCAGLNGSIAKNVNTISDVIQKMAKDREVTL